MHTLTPAKFLTIYAILAMLTIASISVAFVDIGAWHILVGLCFGTAKAVLVVLFFMHVIHSSRLTWTVILGGLLWLGILLSLTMSDYLTRGWLAY